MHGQIIHLGTLWQRHRALTIFGCLCLMALIPSFIMSQTDPTLFNGVSTWTKPMKFQLSIGVYALTLAWFIGNLTDEARTGWRTSAIAWAVLLSGLFEVVYITWQGAQGEASHFNYTSVFHTIMYQLMGVGALFLTISSIPLALRLRRQSVLPHGAYRSAVIWGLMITGVLGLVTGGVISGLNGHWVGGAPTDAGGLPFFGWVRDGGDLRPAHFFALHAIHILPVTAAVLAALGLRGAGGAKLIKVLSITYIAITLLTLMEALMGKPFLGMLLP